MQILLISSSPRKEKSQTFLLAKEVLNGCCSVTETEVIHLCDYKEEALVIDLNGEIVVGFIKKGEDYGTDCR